MSSFLQNLIHRHSQSSAAVMPRLAGVFEPGTAWTTTESPVEEQREMNNMADHKMERNNLGSSLPIKEEEDAQRNISDDQQTSELAKENFKAKNFSSPKINNKESSNKIENIEKVITQQQILVEYTNIDRKEDKVYEKVLANNEIEKVLARLEAMEVLQNKPKTDLHKPHIEFNLPELHKESVRPSIEQSMPKDLSQPLQPVIKIHIGKIEIKAEKQENTRVVKSPMPKPGLTLDQYLQDRKSKS